MCVLNENRFVMCYVKKTPVGIRVADGRGMFMYGSLPKKNASKTFYLLSNMHFSM